MSINWRHKARTGALPCATMSSALQCVTADQFGADRRRSCSWTQLDDYGLSCSQQLSLLHSGKSLNGSSDNWGRSFLFVDKSQPDCFSARHEWNLIDVDDLEFVVAVMPPNRWAGEAGQRYPFIDAPAECLIERGCTTALPLFHDECMRALMTARR